MELINISPGRTEEIIESNYAKFVLELQEFLKVNPKELPETYREKYAFVLEELELYIWLEYNIKIPVYLYYKQELAMWIGRNKNNLQSLFERILSFWGDPDLDCYRAMVEIIEKGREIQAIKKLNYKLRFKPNATQHK